jgi:hypothetical protein
VAKYKNTKMRKERKGKEVKSLVGALIASHTNQDHLIRLPLLDTRRDNQQAIEAISNFTIIFEL